MYTWGRGESGCLGHNDEANRLVPTKLDRGLLGGCGVVMVSAGALHSVAVTAKGALFAWGEGEYGQLGVGDKHNRLTPTRLGEEDAFDGSRPDSRVRMAAWGSLHTLAVTEAGSIWSWGHGGVLGHDDFTRLIPTRVEAQHLHQDRQRRC